LCLPLRKSNQLPIVFQNDVFFCPILILCLHSYAFLATFIASSCPLFFLCDNCFSSAFLVASPPIIFPPFPLFPAAVEWFARRLGPSWYVVEYILSPAVGSFFLSNYFWSFQFFFRLTLASNIPFRRQPFRPFSSPTNPFLPLLFFPPPALHSLPAHHGQRFPRFSKPVRSFLSKNEDLGPLR